MFKKNFFGPFFEKKVSFFVKKMFFKKNNHSDLFTAARSYATNNAVHFIDFAISLLKINHF